MKDFDAEWAVRDSLEERTFKFRGEEFVRKVAVAPERYFGYDERLSEAKTTGGDVAQLAVIEAQLLMCIEDTDDAHDRFRALREAEDTQVGIPEMTALLDWLNDELARRPTSAPSSSGNGRARTGTPSTARPSSTVAAD